ncbi:EAL domain-containing protein [Robbsia sp. KACC 23696]|uniref:putative bifunctional diguanylate cyclase/phosphodiesterase n=1 Tax=Robbsia sp. KACC 23696 TaxID=3149231 RepID=UPI00325B6E61
MSSAMQYAVRSVLALARLLTMFRHQDKELVRSQYLAFSRQVPLLYFVLTINTATVSYTHMGSAPAWLTLYAPGLLILGCIVRMTMWRLSRHVHLSDADIAQRIRNVSKVIAVLGILFTSWGVTLFQYGDAYQRSHVAFYMAITVITVICCLTHLRVAALLLTGIVMVPYSSYFFWTGNQVLIAIAINVVLVLMSMTLILRNHAQDFRDLIDSKKRLLHTNHDMQQLSDENFRLANIDSLTLLPNRRHFFSIIDELLSTRSRAGQSPTPFAVGVLDLDGFKQVNDLYGHRFGDSVLAEVGKRLLDFNRDDVFFARLGGDEFGLILMHAVSREAAVELGNAVCAALHHTHAVREAVARMSASLGLALFPEAGDTPEQLFERADYALYFAKKQRRGSAAVFSTEHETEIRHVAAIEQAMRTETLSEEVTLVFQPIFDATERRIVAFESLARWNSPTIGRVDPSEFIGIAERTGMITVISQSLLRRALAFIRKCPESIRISFNLSSLDLTSDGALDGIVAIVEQSGVAPARIEFEITETAIINDFERASAALATLKAIGAQIALDDFGTGFSSLSRVHRLPLDKIKVDRAFIAQLETEPQCQKIVKSIADLCANLHLECVIEGVENVTQVEMLQQVGCRLMQGYYFGRPVEEALALAQVRGHDGMGRAEAQHGLFGGTLVPASAAANALAQPVATTE